MAFSCENFTFRNASKGVLRFVSKSLAVPFHRSYLPRFVEVFVKTLISLWLTAAVFSPAAFAQFGTRPFYCMNRYNSVNVRIQGNQVIATLNIPVSSDADGYMGDFISPLQHVRYTPIGTMSQLVATSNTYYQSHWTGRQTNNFRPGRGTLTIMFQAMEIQNGTDLAIFATGLLKQPNGRTITFPLGWCRPPAT